jgi:cysteine desulfurase
MRPNVLRLCKNTCMPFYIGKRVWQGAVAVNGPPDASKRLPNTLSVSIRGFTAGAALGRLSERLAASAGAACHSAVGQPGGTGAGGAPHVSPVLRAMGMPTERALGTLRLSVGRHTTAEEVDAAVAALREAAAEQGVVTALP